MINTLLGILVSIFVMDFGIISIHCKEYFSQSIGVCGYPELHLTFENFSGLPEAALEASMAA